jgi:hypothetical protein
MTQSYEANQLDGRKREKERKNREGRGRGRGERTFIYPENHQLS